MGLATPHQFLGPFGNLKQHVFCKSDPTGLLKGSRSPLSQTDARKSRPRVGGWVLSTSNRSTRRTSPPSSLPQPRGRPAHPEWPRGASAALAGATDVVLKLPG